VFCIKMGHYAVTCPNKKKKKKQVAASAEVDELSYQFEDFSLIVCMSTSRYHPVYGTLIAEHPAICQGSESTLQILQSRGWIWR